MHSRAHASTSSTTTSRVGVATRATAARGKVAVITGANTGIGLETARGLYLDDSHRFSEIILAVRDWSANPMDHIQDNLNISRHK